MGATVLFLTIIFLATCNGQDNTRIVGGEELEDLSDYMFVVSFLSLQNGNYSLCGGTLIDPRHVITAGHCAPGVSYIVVGSNNLIYGGSQYDVEKSVPHPDFSGSPSYRNDIAVLTLTEDVTEVTEFPKRPTSELNDFDISCTALGKGLTSYPNGTASPKLKKTNVRPISKIQCDYDWRGLVPRKTICATTDGTGTCYGDSGGPLLCNDELTGVVSFGYPCGTGVPDIYTDVYDFNDWIDSEIGEN
ncbi:hypothetical protein MTP99_006974 [Tenebrio molitor]|nr:hypothetical protein MTP99_006974 [Tenebrio molitor]